MILTLNQVSLHAAATLTRSKEFSSEGPIQDSGCWESISTQWVTLKSRKFLFIAGNA
jgi:hypothetical protein